MEDIDRLRASEVQRVLAEEALRVSEERLRALLANLPSAAWTCDIKGRSVYISPNVERITGYTAEEVVAGDEQMWFGRIHPDDLENVKRAYRSLFEEGWRFDVEYRIRHRNGNWLWVLDQAIATYE